MSFIREVSKTATLSTVGAATAYSTMDGNGFVAGVYVSISKAIGASGKVTITTTSTAKAIAVVVDPSTLGSVVYPYVRAQGTTANVLASSAPVPIVLSNERIRVKVASSSGLYGGNVVARVYLR